jgi:hypothetical protein
MTQNTSLRYFIRGLSEGLKSLLKENKSNKVKETIITQDEFDELGDNCNNEDCLDARMRLNNARNKLLVACTNIKDQEGTRNIHAGAATAAFVATIAFMYKVIAIGTIISLWIIAAGIAIALTVNDSKSLISAQKKLGLLKENYSKCLEEFKTILNIVHEYCDPYCMQSLDMTVPSYE